MTWGAIGGAVVGGIMGGGGGSSSQGGTTVQSRDPWAAAQPWMQQNLQTGQNLQNHYQRNPFNQQQLGAYSNLSQGTNYMNGLAPSLLQQMSQPQGFNRSNPRQGPQALNFASPGVGTNLGFGGVKYQAPQTAAPANPYDSMPAAPAAAPAPVPQYQTNSVWSPNLAGLDGPF
jgi:hypothetical protein